MHVALCVSTYLYRLHIYLTVLNQDITYICITLLMYCSRYLGNVLNRTELAMSKVLAIIVVSLNP